MIIPLMSNSARQLMSKVRAKILSEATCPVQNITQSATQKFDASWGKTLRVRLLAGVLSTLTLTSLTVSAQQQSAGCLPDLISPLQPIPTVAIQANGQQLPQVMEADSLTQPTQTTYLLEGSTHFKQPGMVVLSEQVRFDKTAQTAQFEGNVEIHQKDIIINAAVADLDDSRGVATLSETKFQLLPSRTYGQSKKITLHKESSNAELDLANLTTCKKEPNKSLPWNLHFEEIRIDNQIRRVIGKNTTLRVKEIPVFYTPYFSYPLDDRASGLLFPAFGSAKSLTQETPVQYISAPYYFNIADNMDDTLTVMPMTHHGLVLDNEFRYLAKHNNIRHRAELNISILQDQLTAKEGLVSADGAGQLTYGEKITDRWRAKIKADQNWGYGFSSEMLWQATSDELFHSDIPVDPTLGTVTQTPRYLKVNYQQDNLQAYAQYLGYLGLRDAPLNYEKRPDIGLSYQKQTEQLNFNLTANAVDFRMPVSEHSRPEAMRLSLQPTLDYQLNKPYGALKATVIANQRQYEMHDNGYNTTGAASHSLFVPQYALKGGLIFERSLQLAGSQFTQTLEPQIQYLYVPYEDQSSLPLFDTGNRSLDFSNLFALNRFTGTDRIGDANQVAMALTTKLLNENGRQIADAGIGQVRYLADRQVGLTDNQLQTDLTSDVFVKLGLNTTSVFYGSTAQFDKETFELKHATSRIKYQPSEYSAVLLNHVLTNYNTPTQSQIYNFGGYSQMTAKWQLGAYANYDKTNERINKYNLGIRYDSCCWAAEILAEHTQLSNDLYNDNFQIQFELKGLSTSEQTFKKYLAEKLNF